MIPQQKIVANGNEIQGDCVSSTVWRPESAVSRASIVAKDSNGRHFIDELDSFDVLAISYKYAHQQTWTKVFEGKIRETNPEANTKNKITGALAYGYGKALLDTHCAVNYGVESENSGFDTPSEIIDDLKTNRINKNFDGGNTGYNILGGNILAMANPSIQFLKGGYRNNFDILNQVVLLYQAYRDGASGIHWFVDPSRYLWVDQIGNHTVDTINWNTWWRGTQAASTFTEGIDFINAKFSKNAKEYANKIVLFTDLRKPGYDYWTEDSGGSALWGNDSLTSITDSAAEYVVGSHSLLFTAAGADDGYGYYPSTEDAGWDFTKIGSKNSVPTLNFYYYRNAAMYAATTWVILFTTDHETDAIYCPFVSDAAGAWYHKSIPIGPYWKTANLTQPYSWTAFGGAGFDWSNVNGICFFCALAAGGLLYVDDLHFSGKLIREAYDSDEITANDEVQKTVRLDISVDDSMKEADDTGTAASLAYAELIRAMTIPTTGSVTIKGTPDILPGQQVYINAHKAYNTYRIADTFRATQIIHHFENTKFSTQLDLTDDLVNSFGSGPGEQLSALAKVLYIDPEAKSLKSSGVDELVERLSIDYA